MRIFLLEDDPALQKGIALKLSREGHEVICADSLLSARKAIEEPFDIAVIDINLPDGSGLDVCKNLRERSLSTHILILTANDTEMDVITGYELGTDDYVTKPFSLSVLLSKIGAVQRRLGTMPKTLMLDAARQAVTVHGKTVELTRNEWRLLRKLSENAGQIVTKEQLLEAIWDIDSDFVNENTLAVNIRRLREKIENDPSMPSVIENIRGVGYRFIGDNL